MLSFGIIAEGPTDQAVIENIIHGFFSTQGADVSVQFIQPPRPLTEVPGGWGNVFNSLRRDYDGALQYNTHLVIQIDTDRQEDPGYDVPRREAGRELSVAERIERVILRLKECIDPDFLANNQHRFCFAIAVESIECWLLPLLDDNPKKAAKTTGCEEAANRALRRANQDALSAGTQKFVRAYGRASQSYRKYTTLMQLHDKNPSLCQFVRQLQDLSQNINTSKTENPES